MTICADQKEGSDSKAIIYMICIYQVVLKAQRSTLWTIGMSMGRDWTKVEHNNKLDTYNWVVRGLGVDLRTDTNETRV